MLYVEPFLENRGGLQDENPNTKFEVIHVSTV